MQESPTPSLRDFRVSYKHFQYGDVIHADIINEFMIADQLFSYSNEPQPLFIYLSTKRVSCIDNECENPETCDVNHDQLVTMSYNGRLTCILPAWHYESSGDAYTYVSHHKTVPAVGDVFWRWHQSEKPTPERTHEATLRVVTKIEAFDNLNPHDMGFYGIGNFLMHHCSLENPDISDSVVTPIEIFPDSNVSYTEIYVEKILQLEEKYYPFYNQKINDALCLMQ